MVALAIAVILIKLPTLDTPAFWDETGFLRQAEWLSQGSLHRAIPGFRPGTEFFGHPPGLHLIHAALGKVFGVSVTTAHALIALFSVLGTCGTFLLARSWHGTGAGWLAAILLLLSPVYVAQSGMFLADLPVTALGVLAAYFFLENRYFPYLACAACMVLLKETAIVLVVALLLYRFVVLHPLRQARLEDLALWGLPLTFIGAFLLLQKVATGHFFFIYDFDVELFRLTPALAWHQFGLITRWIFIDQHRFILTGLIALNLVVNAKARRREHWLVAFVVVLSGYSFSVLYFLPRYLLPVLPFFYILGAISILELARRPMWQGVAAAVASCMMVWSLRTQPLSGNGETSLRYLDVVAMHRAAIDRITGDRPAAKVLTHWPLTQELQHPFLGYVDHPVDVKSFGSESDLAGADAILVSHPGNGSEARLRELARRDGRRLILRQVNETAWIEIYARASSPAPASNP
jgi:hypothetical protein